MLTSLIKRRSVHRTVSAPFCGSSVMVAFKGRDIRKRANTLRNIAAETITSVWRLGSVR